MFTALFAYGPRLALVIVAVLVLSLLSTSQSMILFTQFKSFLGANARRLYNIQAPTTIIRERVCAIQRPDWWPTEEEIKASLRPEASVTRR